MSLLSKLFVILVFVIALIKLGIDVTLFAQKVDWKDKFIKEVNYHYQTQQIKNAEIAARDMEVENQRAFMAILADRINTLDTENSGKAARIDAWFAGPKLHAGVGCDLLIPVRRTDRHELGAGAFNRQRYRVMK